VRRVTRDEIADAVG